mmetsp:Transcript_7078/g.18585  ORF Transcript_7078/g.18585 Transcript_7078/m.18585 type:complete len:222 (-) Transcript_7078:34-699(-)
MHSCFRARPTLVPARSPHRARRSRQPTHTAAKRRKAIHPHRPPLPRTSSRRQASVFPTVDYPHAPAMHAHALFVTGAWTAKTGAGERGSPWPSGRGVRGSLAPAQHSQQPHRSAHAARHVPWHAVYQRHWPLLKRTALDVTSDVNAPSSVRWTAVKPAKLCGRSLSQQPPPPPVMITSHWPLVLEPRQVCWCVWPNADSTDACRPPRWLSKSVLSRAPSEG